MKTVKRVSLSGTVGGGYDDFWNCTKRYRVLKGGKASKKSSTAALNFIYRIMRYPGSNLLVVRAVMNTHRDSTFAQLIWAQEKLKVSFLWKNTVSPMEMTYLPTGQKILFRGFDDVLKLASTTVAKGHLCWVWIEEAFELASEDDFDKLDLSVPRGEIPAPLFKQTTLTFNPWSEKHWLKKRFFDFPDSDTTTYTTNYLNNEFLDDVDRKIYQKMKESNPRKYDVAGLGNWGIAEGLVFENFEELDFDVNSLGIERDKTNKIVSDTSWQYKTFFGLDYGYTNDPTAFIVFRANPITKEIFIFDEHYETKMLNSDIANMIIKKGYAKERIRADAAEPKSNDDLRRMGIMRIAPSVKGKDSIINGINAIKEFKIFVHPKCKNTLSELYTYVWKQNTDGSGINEPEDKNNHLMDALRYAFYDVRFFHPTNEKPKTPPERKYGIAAKDISGDWG